MTVQDLLPQREHEPSVRDGGPLAAAAGPLAALGFGLASAVRRARIFHPDGAAYRATVDVTEPRGGSALLGRRGRHRAVVRLSRGVGVPAPLPDILGLAVRIEDAYGDGQHQDLLLVTSSGPPVLRRLLVPASTFASARYSSLLPYRAGAARIIVGARPLPADESVRPRTFEELTDDLASARLRFQLDVAPVGGPWEPLGTIEVGQRLTEAESESLTFNPWNTGGGLEPAGFLNAVRRAAYAGSQRFRPRPLPDVE